MRRVLPPCPQREHARAGITFLDIVVVIVLIWIMAAVFLPMLQNTSPVNRRGDCLDNLKQLSMGTLNYAGKKHGKLPCLREYQGSARVCWAVSLLPEIDNASVYREFYADPVKFQLGDVPSLKALQCRADPFNFTASGGLSYAANAGYIREDIFDQTASNWELGHNLAAVDWDKNGALDKADMQIALATGVFWPALYNAERFYRVNQPEHTMTLDYISAHDGAAHTLLYAENLQARNWHRADALHDFAFGVPVNPERDFVNAGISRALDFRPSFEKQLRDRHALPFANFIAKPGTAARPSSYHVTSKSSFVNMAFADGSARSISGEIDWRVYVRLLTPNGQEYGQSSAGLDNY